jgi:DNA-binding transcriptional regulator/RsmH inhibitor MraZ
MQEGKEKLHGTLNLRIGGKLESEIERIAEAGGKTASETARQLLAYGVEVERRLEAQRLMQHHESEFGVDVAGRIVISAEFVPYTWREAAEIQAELEEAAAGRPSAGLPRWEDLTP